jgi:hypothetical protein
MFVEERREEKSGKRGCVIEERRRMTRVTEWYQNGERERLQVRSGDVGYEWESEGVGMDGSVQGDREEWVDSDVISTLENSCLNKLDMQGNATIEGLLGQLLDKLDRQHALLVGAIQQLFDVLEAG